MKALVFSGGGAKGAYQVGAWRAFRKLGISFDIVTGTSVGAFNAALYAQNDFRKAFKIWKNMNYSFVFEDSIDLDNKKELIKIYAKSMIKYGGMNVDALYNNVRKNIDYKKFSKSNIDFGMITFNLSSKKEVRMKKKDLTESNLADFLMASATCYPAFPKKIINGDAYIDGGYVNDMPVDLAIEMGANEIVAINLGSFFAKDVKFNNHSIKVIKPRNSLDSFFGFDKKISRRLIKLGFNDVMKEYSALDGIKYTFKKGMVRKSFNKYQMSYMENCVKFLGNSVSYMNLNTFFGKYELSFLKMMESAIEIFNMNDSRVYSLFSFNFLLKRNLRKTVIPRDIKLMIKNNKKIIQAQLVKHFYNLLCENKKAEIRTLSLVFKKEFLIAMYIYTI